MRTWPSALTHLLDACPAPSHTKTQMAILSHPAAFVPAADEPSNRLVRVKAAVAVAAIASAPCAAQALALLTRSKVLTKGLAPLLAAEPDGPVGRALSKAQEALMGANTTATAKEEATPAATAAAAAAAASGEAVLGADKDTQTEGRGPAAAPTAAGGEEEIKVVDVKEPKAVAIAAEAIPATASGSKADCADTMEVAARTQARSPSRSRSPSSSGGRSPSRSYSRSRSRSGSYSRVSSELCCTWCWVQHKWMNAGSNGWLT